MESEGGKDRYQLPGPEIKYRKGGGAIVHITNNPPHSFHLEREASTEEVCSTRRGMWQPRKCTIQTSDCGAGDCPGQRRWGLSTVHRGVSTLPSSSWSQSMTGCSQDTKASSSLETQSFPDGQLGIEDFPLAPSKLS